MTAALAESVKDVVGRSIETGPVTVTRAMIETYARAVGDLESAGDDVDTAPPTFCLTLRRGMTPEVALPPGIFGVYGGHDIEFHLPIRAGESYRVRAEITDVFEKSGRSGTLTVIVREAAIRDAGGRLVTRITERQILRRRPDHSAGARGGITA